MAKLGKLDEQYITREKRKFEQVKDSTNESDIAYKEHITKHLKSVQGERAARIEIISTNKNSLRIQVSRIRENNRKNNE